MSELRERVSSYEFTEWQVFASQEPIGDEREDWRMAVMMAHFANLFARGKDHPQPYEVSDFMPSFEPPPEKGPEELLHLAEMINTAFGGQDKRVH